MSVVKFTNIYEEFVEFIGKVLGCFDLLKEYRAAFEVTFQRNHGIKVILSIIFRDVEPLRTVYFKINELINKQKSEKNLFLPKLFLDHDIYCMMIFHKPFLASYENNMKWIKQVQKYNKHFRRQLETYRKNLYSEVFMNFVEVYEIIFNCLFDLKTVFDKYVLMHPENSTAFIQGKEALWLIKDVIQKSFQLQNSKFEVQLRHSVRKYSREAVLLTEVDFITIECMQFLKTILRCLSDIIVFKDKIDIEFQHDIHTKNSLKVVFSDVEPLKIVRKIMNSKFSRLKNENQLCLPDLLSEKDIEDLSVNCKPFAGKYYDNIRIIAECKQGQFYFTNYPQRRQQTEMKLKFLDIEECFDEVYNMMTSFGNLIDKYATCFHQFHPNYEKAQRMKRNLQQFRKQSMNYRNQMVQQFK